MGRFRITTSCLSTKSRGIVVSKRAPLTFTEISNERMQKGLKNKQSAGHAKRVGWAAKHSYPGSAWKVEPLFSPGRPRPHRRTVGPTDGGTVPAPLSPTSSQQRPGLAPSGEGVGTAPEVPRPGQPSAASSGAPHRSCHSRSVPRLIALGTRRPRCLLPLRPMAPTRTQFENGAERRSRPTRRERPVAPVTDRSDPQWRRARRAEMAALGLGARKRNGWPMRGYGSPWREARTSAVPEDLD